MPDIDPTAISERETYYLLTGLCVPRPIAWVSTLAADGTRNLAPHSYFNVCSSDPPVAHFTSSGVKDTLTNVRTSGEFVINIVSVPLLEQMNRTAADFPAGEDEFSWADLESAASTAVAPPRVAAAPAALECRVRHVLSIGTGHMVFGDVVHIHVADRVWRNDRVDPELLQPLGRLAGSDYAEITEVTRLPRPTWDELRRR